MKICLEQMACWASVIALAGCGGSGTSPVTQAPAEVIDTAEPSVDLTLTDDPVVDLDPVVSGTLAFEGFGVTFGTVGSNGTTFATGAESYKTLDASPITLRMIRLSRDPATREIEVILSDETFSLVANRHTLFTLGDEDWDTSNMPDGIYVQFYNSIIANNVGELLIADATGGIDEIFELGWAVLGRETDPLDIATATGNATYEGQLRLMGFPSVDGARESEFNAIAYGDLDLRVALDDQMVNGVFELEYIWGATLEGAVMTGEVATAPITGNGFTSTMTITGCADGVICRGEGELGGIFYDADAAVLAGVARMAMEIDNLPIITGVAQAPINTGVVQAHQMQTVGYFDTDKVTD